MFQVMLVMLYCCSLCGATIAAIILFITVSEAVAQLESNENSKSSPSEVLASFVPYGVRHHNPNNVSVRADESVVIGRNVESLVIKTDGSQSSIKEQLDIALESSRRLAGLAEPRAPSFVILGGNGAYMYVCLERSHVISNRCILMA